MEPTLIAYVDYQGPWSRRALLALTLLRTAGFLVLPWYNGVLLHIHAKVVDNLEV